MKIEQLIEHWDFKKVLIAITYTILLIFAIFRFEKVMVVVIRILSILSPFMVGFAMAFVLNILVDFFEKRLLNKINIKWIQKQKRGISMISSLIVLTLTLALVILLIVPELVSSIKVLADKIPDYAMRITSQVVTILEDNNISSEVTSFFQKNGQKIFSDIANFSSNFLGSAFSVTMGVTSGLFNFVMSLIIALYLLGGKEKLIKNLKYMLYAFLPKNNTEKIINIGKKANIIFRSFVTGQCTEALILGTLCFIGMTILKLPYALLVSTVISVTALVPIFGAYIGAAVGVFVIFMVKPISSLYFLIFILVLQQFENNFIYPKVVGTSIGLPPLLVMVAIFSCGNIMGIAGILLGVPTFSLIYLLLKETVRKKITTKELTHEEIVK